MQTKPEVILLRCNNINELLKSDEQANKYFHTLSSEVQNGLLAHGDGINNLKELKHFAGIIEKQGGNPHSGLS